MTTIDGTPAVSGRPARPSLHLRQSPIRLRDLRTAGLVHVPRAGGAVLALTHFAHRELALVELAVRRHRHRRIHSIVLNGRVDEPNAGSMLRPLRRIFVDLSAGADAYAEALQTLRHGELVALFPEATGDDPLAGRELRIGAARLAIEAGVPLIPVVVWCERGRDAADAERARTSGDATTRVVFGQPIPMQPAEDVRAVTDELRATIQRILLGLVRT